jgi:outer membrane lipase/esterase
LLANLVALHQQTGANIHFFDTYTFVNQIRANPTAYGYTAAGVAPNVACTLNQPVACGTLTFAQQNQFLSIDGIHWSYRFHEQMAQAIANQLLAPDTMASQADLVDATAQAFSNATMRRLQDNRTRSMMSNLMSADLPLKAPPPPPPGTYGPFAFYLEGLYAGGDRSDRLGGAGISYNVGGVTFGADYRIAPNLLVGLAFNYSNPSADLTQGWGRMSADAYQLSGYASWTYRNWFLDLAATGGVNKLSITRPGLISSLTASPDGTSFVAQGKTGYLFDVGALSAGAANASSFRVGPIVGFSYSHVNIDGYTEMGDPLLTQQVNAQSVDGFTGRAGIEFRSAYLWGTWAVSPWLDLTVEHDFADGARVLTTAQTYAIALQVTTPVANGNDTYGRVAGGLSAQVAQNMFLNINGEATFGRDAGNDYGLSGGLKVVW